MSAAKVFFVAVLLSITSSMKLNLDVFDFQKKTNIQNFILLVQNFDFEKICLLFFCPQKNIFWDEKQKDEYSFDVKFDGLSIYEVFRTIRALLRVFRTLRSDSIGAYMSYIWKYHIVTVTAGFKITVFICVYEYG